MKIIESKIRLRELVGLKDLLYEFNDLQIIDINLLIIKNFSGYLNYYLLILKVIITLINKSKFINIRVILNIKVEFNIISLNIALRFKILITYNTRISL